MQNLYNRSSFEAGLPKCAAASPNRPRITNTFLAAHPLLTRYCPVWSYLGPLSIGRRK